jgi:hypothetical protein
MDFTTLIILNDLYKSYTEITILRTVGKTRRGRTGNEAIPSLQIILGETAGLRNFAQSTKR